ncbi:hypothetical protein ACWCPM_11030 [Streptomyces sp. NPDC002309]
MIDGHRESPFEGLFELDGCGKWHTFSALRRADDREVVRGRAARVEARALLSRYGEMKPSPGAEGKEV